MRWGPQARFRSLPPEGAVRQRPGKAGSAAGSLALPLRLTWSEMDIDAFVDAQCALLGLTLTPEQRPGVVRYLQLVAGMAPRVTEFAATLTPADESGNTFVPVAPRSPAP
jgi:hypothetical protein